MDTYIHYKTKNLYIIIDCGASEPLLENPETKEWTPAVVYQEYSHLNPETQEYERVESPRIFIRSKESFFKSFSLCQL